MQKHYDNALKLEQQGFISKGQRMQFEVAKTMHNAVSKPVQANLKASLFQLNNLLQSSQITELTTPLFINSTQNQDLNTLLRSYADQSALVQNCKWTLNWHKPMSPHKTPPRNPIFLPLVNTVWTIK